MNSGIYRSSEHSLTELNIMNLNQFTKELSLTLGFVGDINMTDVLCKDKVKLFVESLGGLAEIFYVTSCLGIKTCSKL